MRHLITFSVLFWVICAGAQINDFKYERFVLTEGFDVVKSFSLSPNKEEIAVSTIQGNLKFYDSESFTELRSFKINDFGKGAQMYYSASGRYLVARRLRTVDWNPDKDKQVFMAIIDTQTGSIVVKKSNVFDMDISPNDETYSYMDEGRLVICSFPDGKEIASNKDDRLKSSLCYGPDGTTVYASRGFDKSDLKKDPRFKKNKKGAKYFSKYQQTIVGYSASDLSQSFISDETFDEIYEMRLSKKKDRILISVRQNGNFVLQMQLGTGKLLREQFNSTITNSEFKENLSKDLFGITTNEAGDSSHSVMLYDASTNEIIAKFDVDNRFMENLQQDAGQDGSAHFDFSPDEKYLLTAIGNTLFKWKIKRQD